MTYSLSALASIGAGILWILGFVATTADAPGATTLLVVATALCVGALVARLQGVNRPPLAVLGVGAVVVAGTAFAVAVVGVAIDARPAGVAAWDVMWASFLGLMIANVLVAAVSFGDAGVSRPALALIGLGAATQAGILVALMTGVVRTGLLASPWAPLAGAVAFGIGWALLGASSHQPRIRPAG